MELCKYKSLENPSVWRTQERVFLSISVPAFAKEALKRHKNHKDRKTSIRTKRKEFLALRLSNRKCDFLKRNLFNA